MKTDEERLIEIKISSKIDQKFPWLKHDESQDNNNNNNNNNKDRFVITSLQSVMVTTHAHVHTHGSLSSVILFCLYHVVDLTNFEKFMSL